MASAWCQGRLVTLETQWNMINFNRGAFTKKKLYCIHRVLLTDTCQECDKGNQK